MRSRVLAGALGLAASLAASGAIACVRMAGWTFTEGASPGGSGRAGSGAGVVGRSPPLYSPFLPSWH